jgi:serine/threonine protein kinase/Tol biopolymer transport system component
MTPERWQQIDEVFQAAVVLGPSERAAFLKKACGADRVTHDRVSAMLASDDSGWDLIEHPALEVGAPVLADDRPQLTAEQHIGHYQIIHLIGRGGMGEVYLARDKRLNRKIALKLLPAGYLQQRERLRRFEQEAQAASALNHPNILTIYEIGEIDGQQFIATEFVEGETLRERLKRGDLSSEDAMDIAIQIGGALAAAHNAGIIHRDIKPENLMLRPDGYVKVLDFGLAKLTEHTEELPDAKRAPDIDISSGLVMGTVRYMSPEQARGLSVDQRSDIFSLGVVLYEMLTGGTPCQGNNAADLVSEILNQEPLSLTERVPDAPEGLQWVVDKALAKDKKRRYQTAVELLDDLKPLRVRLHDLAQPRSSLPTNKPTPTQPTLTAITSIGHVREITHKPWAVLLAAAVVLAVGVAFLTFRLLGRDPSRFSSQSMTFRRLATTGKVFGAAISRDGNRIAYVADETGQRSLWVRDVNGASNLRIVGPGLTLDANPTFSPDGNYIYYRAIDINTRNDLYRIHAWGGDAEKLIVDIDSPVTFSPDGKRLAFTRNNNPVVGQSNLLTANVDGTDERLVSTRELSNALFIPAWSPDGKVLACLSGFGTGPFLLVEVQVETKQEKRISSQPWSQTEQIAWLSDGSALMLTARNQSSGQTQVWQVAYPSGEVHRVTNDLNSYTSVSLTADARTMAVVQRAVQSDIWVSPALIPSEAGAITSEAGKDYGSQGLAWTPDDKLICASNASGNLDLWMIDSGGGGVPKQLTANAGQNYDPAVTPDGRYIVFVSDRSGSRNLWRINIDGSNPLRLTTGRNDHFPSCSPDSKWVVYNSPSTSLPTTLWRVPIDGGAPVQLTDEWAVMPSVSPDGKQVACYYFEGPGANPKLATGLIPFNGGSISKISELAGFPNRWLTDGSAIGFVSPGTSNVLALPMNGGPPKQLTNFKSGQIFWFDWSHDGRLAIARGTTVSDVVLIDHFR